MLGLFSGGNEALALSILSLTSGTEVKDSWSYSADFPVCVQCVDRENFAISCS